MAFPEDPVDVLIVGAGASAAVAAGRLTAAGLSVICLEQGDWHDRSEYRGSSPDWELTSRKQWASDPGVRSGPADYPVDVTDSDMGVGMFNGVGGGTVLFNAVWPRLAPADFRVASVDGVADDWPITYDDLLPYYEETDRQFGVSGLGGNPVYPGEANPPCPPLPIGRGGLLVARAHARLGWQWWPDANAIASTISGGRSRRSVLTSTRARPLTISWGGSTTGPPPPWPWPWWPPTTRPPRSAGRSGTRVKKPGPWPSWPSRTTWTRACSTTSRPPADGPAADRRRRPDG